MIDDFGELIKQVKAVVGASGALFFHLSEKDEHTKKEQRLMKRLEKALLPFAEEETL